MNFREQRDYLNDLVEKIKPVKINVEKHTKNQLWWTGDFNDLQEILGIELPSKIWPLVEHPEYLSPIQYRYHKSVGMLNEGLRVMEPQYLIICEYQNRMPEENVLRCIDLIRSIVNIRNEVTRALWQLKERNVEIMSGGNWSDVKIKMNHEALYMNMEILIPERNKYDFIFRNGCGFKEMQEAEFEMRYSITKFINDL